MKQKSSFQNTCLPAGREEYWLLKEKYHFLKDKHFQQDINRIRQGEPVDYVIGFKKFLGCIIDLSKRPLIPRAETEFWVKEAIAIIKQEKRKTIKVLDIFSGSGCIGIALIAKISNATVVFADKSQNAIEQIKINATINHLPQKKIKIVMSDVFNNVSGRFDYIFLNPPYIPVKNKKKVVASVFSYEPKSALFGGSDGLFYIKKFLSQAHHFLDKQGKIFMEFDPPQKPAIGKLVQKYGYHKTEFKKDQYNKWRWVIIHD